MNKEDNINLDFLAQTPSVIAYDTKMCHGIQRVPYRGSCFKYSRKVGAQVSLISEPCKTSKMELLRKQSITFKR